MKFGAGLVLVLAVALAGCGDTASNTDTDVQAQAPSPEPAAFYVGRWAAEPVWCSDQSDGFPITITETRFEGYENVCELTGIEDTPEGGVAARLACQSLGASVEEPITLTPADDQIAITYPERGGDPILFSRCEGQ